MRLALAKQRNSHEMNPTWTSGNGPLGLKENRVKS